MATKKKHDPKSDDWSIDEAGIEKYSRALVAQVLSPSSLMQYVMDHVQPVFHSDEPHELNLLRAALDSRYPEFRKRYDAGEIKDGDLTLQIIEEQVMYFVGLELGRRVSRE